MNALLQIGQNTLFLLLGAAIVAGINALLARRKRNLSSKKKSNGRDISIQKTAEPPPAVNSSHHAASISTAALPIDDSSTQSISLEDVYDVQPLATSTLSSLVVDWPEDQTARADGPSYAVIQGLSATGYDNQSGTSITGRSPRTEENTVEQENSFGPLVMLADADFSSEGNDFERTTRVDDASCALLQRLSSACFGDESLAEDVTLKVLALDLNDEIDVPTRLGDPLHVGESRADWAYAIDTFEMPYPPEPAKSIASASQDANAESDQTAENLAEANGDWNL